MDMSHDLTLSGWATGSNGRTVSSVRYWAARSNSFTDQPRPLVRSEIRQRVARKALSSQQLAKSARI